MKHLHKFNKLNRFSSHRKLMLSNMANSLIKHSRIITTLAKAKELRRVVEKLITKAKKNTLASRRLVLKVLRRPDNLHKLFDIIAPAFANRNGGYTRIIRLGSRKIDNAQMAVVEFVQEFTEIKKDEEKKTTSSDSMDLKKKDKKTVKKEKKQEKV